MRLSTRNPIDSLRLAATERPVASMARDKAFMSTFMKSVLLGLALTLTANQTRAFTLLGPVTAATWQTVRIGYATNPALNGLAGPMNLGEEYRWNVPVIYYGYTPEFLNYFGQRGVDEVEKAIKFLNDLPPASQMNLDNFPLSSQRINHRAQALGLVDVKSWALGLMVQAMGIGDPTRYVFTLRNRWTPPNQTNYHVIKRNFDPVTWQHSSYVNGVLWTYNTILDNATGAPDALAVTEPVDPLALAGIINAPVTSGTDGSGLLQFGGFWTGLTRDDVGGLKYIYRSSNFNVENAPTNAFAGAVGISAGGSGSGVPPWSIPAPPPTNVVGGVAVNTNFVSVALRRGIEKLSFQRVNFDSLLGIFEPFTNSWTDTVITNGQTFNQSLSRPQLIADILFDATDLQGGEDNGGALPLDLIGIQNWVNNEGINGLQGGGDLGPGVIQPATGGTIPAFLFSANAVGPVFINGPYPNFLSEVSALRSFLWGSFDGSTNEPVVYPVGTSIQQIEAQVLGSR